VVASLFQQQLKQKHMLLQTMFVIMLMDLASVHLAQAQEVVVDVDNAKS
jgi:hypothetical protein